MMKAKKDASRVVQVDLIRIQESPLQEGTIDMTPVLCYKGGARHFYDEARRIIGFLRPNL